MTVNCICPKWKEGMKIIIGQACFCQVHSAAPTWPEDNSLMFKFCPWCGKNLTSLDMPQLVDISFHVAPEGLRLQCVKCGTEIKADCPNCGAAK